MEIHHKSKPWHGWRELTKEVGVIAIGIAIALVAGEAIQTVHRRAEVSEARQTLRSEIAQNAAIASFNLELGRCLTARSEQYAAWANGGPLPSELPAGAGMPGYLTSAWSAARAGAVAYMPLEERVAYERFYDLIDVQNKEVEKRQDLFTQLLGLRARTAITATDAQRILELAAQAHFLTANGGPRREWYGSSGDISVIQRAKALGVDPAPWLPAMRAGLAANCGVVGIKPRLPPP